MTDNSAHLARSGRLERLIDGPVRLGRDWLVRFVEVQGFDRAVALAGQAFTALVPLLIVYGSVVSGATGHDFADQLVRLFDLKGSAAASLRQAFTGASGAQSEVSTLGGVLLVLSALSFTRALQRLYQLTFEQPSLGLRAAKWGLIWLAIVIVILTLRPLVVGRLDGLADLICSVAIAAGLWLVTPYVLLARRIPWQRLVPTALLTAVGMTGLELASAIWMPHTVATSAKEFGVIGIAFALLSWLVAAGVVLVVAAAGGSVVDAYLRARPRPRDRDGALSRHHPAG
jgi:membrane protein